MSNPTRIRATAKDGLTEVRLMMQHEMENGRRKDEAGNLVPAWYITDMQVKHQGRTVLSGQFGTSVSKNPYLIFRFQGGNKGERVSVAWTDNRGDSREDQTVID
ncbi:MAG: thiosulfate oxidation carrier complex protein SoxZ [Nitrosomonadales bacterium]|nr:thiosulfate oxidation carrier complex protein SoxZ [Nitrosomonadales bacterium]